MYRYLLCIGVVLCFLTSCEDPKPDPNNGGGTNPPKKVEVPKFNGQNAYDFVNAQVNFGPRVPGSTAHDSCLQWLSAKLKEHGANVQIQETEEDNAQGERMAIRNIIGTFNPEKKNRVLLCAHWDSRHVADKDSDEARRDEPILGADDGGSGVGVLLEIARVIGENDIDLGVDIILFDMEDQGLSSPQGRNQRETWCLGSQYWSRNPHTPNYRAKFGILLDMVGSQGASFPKEGTSMHFAGVYVNKVWKVALDLGYSQLFVNRTSQGITDDHYFVNEIRQIPTIDIINLPEQQGADSGLFGHYWHTHKDNMDVIDKNTLQAVGTTVLHVLYKEAAGVF